MLDGASASEAARVSLSVLPGRFSVCRLDAGVAAPAPPAHAALYAVTRTATELSLVCPEGSEPPGSYQESGWRCLAVAGPLPFTMVGVLAAITGALAAAEISLFALSTFDTDYVLVKEDELSSAVRALEAAGIAVRRSSVM